VPPAFTVVSSFYLILKMEVICTHETSVDFGRSTLRYIPEDIALHKHRCENLKSYKENVGQQIVDQNIHMTYRLACSSSASPGTLTLY
jgi:hypothetical protein